MAKNLVIVESPAKAKTIEKFLGADYKVMSSRGHIRDLAKKSFSYKPEEGLREFTPNYEISEDKTELVRELKAAAKKADVVWLASDEDREGEAIAWHLYEVLELIPEKTRRIVFHEITKDAILNAIENPRDIDINRVNAQQARRVLDRIVGFELSPVLWRKIKPALSAGRVQSVAVRLIVEREKEIENFKAEEYWRVSGTFTTAAGNKFNAALTRRLETQSASEEFLRACTNIPFTVETIETKPVKRSPAPPFTTSTLQQEAARKLGFSVSQTMRIAQDLYESGFITYMRTDSLNLSETAIAAISKEVTEKYGKKYLKVRRYHTNSKGAQEAHEAIRPTYIDKETIAGDQRTQKLYRLIRERAIASQMADMIAERTTVTIAAGNRSEHFSAQGDVVQFDGYRKVYIDAIEESDSENAILPAINQGETLTLANLSALQRQTAQPARYSEGTLVKKMEELGIGRPSTYAPTISTILQREYVAKGERQGSETTFIRLELDPKTGEVKTDTKKELTGGNRGRLIPTDTGVVVNDFLAEYFPDILDYNFTASVEEKFDEIAEGKSEWHEEIGEFYDRFHPEVENALNVRLEHKVGERMLGKDPATGKTVSVKIGRFGPLVQLGDAESDEKPQFASLLKEQSLATITLEEALKLFEFPRLLGDFEGKEVVVAIGPYGPYVKHNNKFVSIPKDIAPASLSLEEAIELIEKKRLDEANRVLRDFGEDAGVQILNGRFGPYIAFNKKNYKIPKSVDPQTLTLEDCRKIIDESTTKTPAKTSKTSKSKK